MLTVGDKLPKFALEACVGPENEFKKITNESYPGKWTVLFFWPMDFTFICPTEISQFGKMTKEFEKRNAVVIGGSTDSQFVHAAWRRENTELRDLPFPMIADVKQELSKELGILHKDAGVCLRATYIVDPEGTIRFASVHDLPTGRSVKEVLRTLDALQCGGLCPVEWEQGEPTLQV